MKKIAALILAAGKSSRLGQPKQLLRYRNSTLMEHAISNAWEAGCKPVITVLGAYAKEIQQVLDPGTTDILVNENWANGLGNSISTGVQHLRANYPDVDAVLLMLCDQPFIGADHLGRLCDKLNGDACLIAATAYPEGKRGAPSVFHKDLFAQLVQLNDDRGAQGIISACKNVATIAAPGKHKDIDTPEDLNRLNEQTQ